MEEVSNDILNNEKKFKDTHCNCTKKKKIKSINIKTRKKETALEKESSENIFPEVIRCRGCMRTHFPSKKLCKLSELKKTSKRN